MGQAPGPSPARKPRRPRMAARARQTTDRGGREPYFSPAYVERPADHLGDWRNYDLNDKTLSRVSPEKLMEMLTDISPEVSRALSDFLSFCNPGYEVTLTQPGMADEPAGPVAEAAWLAIEESIEAMHGSLDVLIGRIFFGGFLRGSLAAELVLNEGGQGFADLATPDPISFYYEPVEMPPRGRVWIPGQYQGGDWVRIDSPLVKIMPIDPMPGSPYGRGFVTPAVFTAIFLIGLLQDLRRVISQQGYPRPDITVNLEALEEAMPESEADDPAAFEEWVNATIAEIETAYSDLEPDDAYVHTSVIEVNDPVGTMSDSSLGIIDELIRSLERFATRALRSMPLFMGSNEAVAETHAKLQVEIYMALIRKVQNYTAAMLESLFTFALRSEGIQAQVNLSFRELRAIDREADARAHALEIANAAALRNEGFLSHQDAALLLLGHEPTGDYTEPASEGDSGELSTDNLEEIEEIIQASALGRYGSKHLESNGVHKGGP